MRLISNASIQAIQKRKCEASKETTYLKIGASRAKSEESSPPVLREKGFIEGFLCECVFWTSSANLRNR